MFHKIILSYNVTFLMTVSYHFSFGMMQAVLKLFRQEEERLTEKCCAYFCECHLQYPHMCSCDDEGEFMTCSENTGLRVEQTDSYRVPWFGCIIIFQSPP